VVALVEAALSPDSLISSALIFPRGRARRVEGGYRLSGRWPFSSGIDPSTWNMFGAVVSDEETGENEPRMFLVPASDYSIIDTWQVIGLAGTGSRDVEVADVFVPAYRTLAIERIKGGPNRGSELNPGHCTSCRRSVCSVAIAGVLLGIARRAIQHFAETTRARRSAYTGRNIADFTNIQVDLSEAAALADAADAIVLRDCDEATRITEAGVVPSIEQRAGISLMADALFAPPGESPRPRTAPGNGRCRMMGTARVVRNENLGGAGKILRSRTRDECGRYQNKPAFVFECERRGGALCAGQGIPPAAGLRRSRRGARLRPGRSPRQ